MVIFHLVEQDRDSRYRLSPLGTSLATAITPLDRWAREWAAATGADEQAARELPVGDDRIVVSAVQPRYVRGRDRDVDHHR